MFLYLFSNQDNIALSGEPAIIKAKTKKGKVLKAKEVATKAANETWNLESKRNCETSQKSFNEESTPPSNEILKEKSLLFSNKPEARKGTRKDKSTAQNVNTISGNTVDLKKNRNNNNNEKSEFVMKNNQIRQARRRSYDGIGAQFETGLEIEDNGDSIEDESADLTKKKSSIKSKKTQDIHIKPSGSHVRKKNEAFQIDVAGNESLDAKGVHVRKSNRKRRRTCYMEFDYSLFSDNEEENEIKPDLRMDTVIDQVNEVEPNPEHPGKNSQIKKAKLQPETAEPEKGINSSVDEPSESQVQSEKDQTNQVESQTTSRGRGRKSQQSKEFQAETAKLEKVTNPSDVVEPSESEVQSEIDQTNQVESQTTSRGRGRKSRQSEEFQPETADPEKVINLSDVVEPNKSKIQPEVDQTNQIKLQTTSRGRRRKSKNAQIENDANRTSEQKVALQSVCGETSNKRYVSSSMGKSISMDAKSNPLSETQMPEHKHEVLIEEEKTKKISRRRSSAEDRLSSFVERQKNLLEKIERDRKKEDNHTKDDAHTNDDAHTKDDANTKEDCIDQTKSLIEGLKDSNKKNKADKTTNLTDNSTKVLDTPSTADDVTHNMPNVSANNELSPIYEFPLPTTEQDNTASGQLTPNALRVIKEDNRTVMNVQSNTIQNIDLTKDDEKNEGRGTNPSSTPKSLVSHDRTRAYTDPIHDQSSTAKRRRTGPSFRAVTNLFDSLSSSFNIYNNDFSTRPLRTSHTPKRIPDDDSTLVKHAPTVPVILHQNVSVKVLEPLEVLMERFK